MRTLSICSAGDPNAVLAWVTHDGSTVRWATPHPKLPAPVRPLVTAAASVWPRRLLRVRKDDRTVHIVESAMTWDDPAWLPTWADAITYSPAADRKYLARIESSPPRDATYTEAVPAYLMKDALRMRPSRCQLVRCPCGHRYVFLTAVCDQCGQPDPLASVLLRGAGRLEAALETRFQGQLLASTMLGALDELSGFLTKQRERMDQPPGESNDRDEQRAALATIAELQAKLSIVGLDAAMSKRLLDGARKSPLEIVESAVSGSLEARRRWIPEAVAGWCPSPRTCGELQAQLSEMWRPVFRDLKAVVDAQSVAIARFVPVYGALTKAAQAPGWADLLRFGLTTLAAVKTMGLSLVFKGVIWAFRDARSKAALERFDEAVATLRRAVATASETVTLAAESERAAAGHRRKAMVAFVGDALAADYARSDDAQQFAIASAVSGLVKGPEPTARSRRRRQVVGRKGRSPTSPQPHGAPPMVSSRTVALVVLLLLALVALLALRF